MRFIKSLFRKDKNKSEKQPSTETKSSSRSSRLPRNSDTGYYIVAGYLSSDSSSSCSYSRSSSSYDSGSSSYDSGSSSCDSGSSSSSSWD